MNKNKEMLKIFFKVLKGEKEAIRLVIPNFYQKSIFTIDYKKLKKQGIKYLIFDLDNTIALVDERKTPHKTKELFEELKKDFTVLIISNNTKKRVKEYSDQLEVDFISMAMKPFTKGLKEVKKRYRCKKSEMCMIGDQLMTDILSGNLYTIFTILVDPLGKKDLKVTVINRFLEKQVLKRLKRKKLFEKGCYYDG